MWARLPVMPRGRTVGGGDQKRGWIRDHRLRRRLSVGVLHTLASMLRHNNLWMHQTRIRTGTLLLCCNNLVSPQLQSIGLGCNLGFLLIGVGPLTAICTAILNVLPVELVLLDG